MEEENANDPNFDVSTIDNIKTSLMGPIGWDWRFLLLGDFTLDCYWRGDFFGIAGQYLRTNLVYSDFQYSTFIVPLFCNLLGL